MLLCTQIMKLSTLYEDNDLKLKIVTIRKLFKQNAQLDATFFLLKLNIFAS